MARHEAWSMTTQHLRRALSAWICFAVGNGLSPLAGCYAACPRIIRGDLPYLKENNDDEKAVTRTADAVGRTGLLPGRDAAAGRLPAPDPGLGRHGWRADSG